MVTEPFSSVPSFFRACCRSAERGGDASYCIAGRELAAHVFSGGLVPYRVEDDVWEGEVESLRKLLMQDRASTDESGRSIIGIPGRVPEKDIFRWFQEHYPGCAAIVPYRRLGTFIQGVRDAFGAECV